MNFGGSGPHNPGGNSNDMHPDDRRNLIIFILIAAVIYFSFDHFVMQPKVTAMRAAQIQAQQEKTLIANGDDKTIAIETRDDIVAEGQRLPINNGAIFGTLPLTGNRIDDIQLSQYVRTLHGSDHVPVLIPAGTQHPKFAEIGWVAEDDSVIVPTKDTRWSVAAGETLSADHPVTMTWSNGQGLTFQKIIALDDHFALSVKQKVTNMGDRAVKLYPYALVAGIGIPEGFSKQPIAHEGPIGYIGDKLHEVTYKELESKGPQSYSADKGWIGITEKYWLVSLIPQQNETSEYRFTRTPTASGQSRYQADIRGSVRDIAAGASVESTTHLFAGAKEVRLLDSYEKEYNVPHFDLAVDFGLYYFLTKPFFYLLSFLGKATGNFGVAIIIFTFMLRLAMFPLNNTSYRSFAKLKKIAPEMSTLREKYPDDKQKLQQELVALYSREKVNPAAGCLPILLQIPIFFALYKVLSVTIEMRHAPFFGWIHDLSAMDPTTIFNLFGLVDWAPPPFLMIGAWPILMMLAMLVQRSMNPPPQDPMQAKMVAYMPYFLTFIMAKFAAGLVIYWTISNTLSVIQQYVIMRSMGVEVKFFHKSTIEKKLEEQVKSVPSVHPEIEMIEGQVEDALTDEGAIANISAPKPRKKKKK